MKILDFFKAVKACFSPVHDIQILLDTQDLNFVVFDGKAEVYRNSSLRLCCEYIAESYYRYGYHFTVHGIPGDYWTECRFRAGELRRENYLLGGV